jgi:hypothetical protein
MVQAEERKRWEGLIVEYAQSGLPVHEWCARNRVTQNQLGYRLRQAQVAAEENPEKQISAKQYEANRKNAKKSTGPRTPEGKAASSKNALKHGIFAKDPSGRKNPSLQSVEWTTVEIMEEAAPSVVVSSC